MPVVIPLMPVLPASSVVGTLLLAAAALVAVLLRSGPDAVGVLFVPLRKHGRDFGRPDILALGKIVVVECVAADLEVVLAGPLELRHEAQRVDGGAKIVTEAADVEA